MGNKVVWALAAMMALTATPRVADACGGCFHQEVSAGGETDSTVVTGHRMVMSISQTQSVLWDQIEYAGDPEEFSWVLPVKPGAVLELASDAWLDVLDGATQPSVGSRTVQCTVSTGGGFGNGGSGFGCGSSEDASAGGGEFDETRQDGQADPVTIVSQATVGPYETVTLSTEQPGVLQDWLESHGYAIPDDIAPVIDDYVAEGFDFVALRLIPGAGVSQMSPVRVVMPGAVLTLPLRLVAAGTGATTALSLLVIAEGSYEAQNFANAVVEESAVIWDYATASSNHGQLRQQALSGAGGETWLRTYSLPNTLFQPISDPATEQMNDVVSYGPGRNTIAGAFMAMAYSGQATAAINSCRDALTQASSEGLTLVDPCDDNGDCRALETYEVAVGDLPCEANVDDLTTALTGMNLGEVWITRLDAELPRAGLGRDLVLQARTGDLLNSRMLATQSMNSPCGDQTTAAPATLGGPLRRVPGGLPTLGVAALGLLLAARRRRRGTGGTDGIPSID